SYRCEAPCRNTRQLRFLCGRLSIAIVKLVSERSALLPTGSFGPNEEHLAIPIDGHTRMFPAFSFTGSRNYLTQVTPTTRRKDLTPGFPSSNNDVSIVGEVHAAHWARVDFPFVQEAAAEGLAPVVGRQEINVPVH